MPSCATCSPRTSTRARPTAPSPRSPNATRATALSKWPKPRPLRSTAPSSRPPNRRSPRLPTTRSIAPAKPSLMAAAAAALPAAAKPEPSRFEPQAKPEPAPLTSGVIQTQQIAAIPGSAEPMKPVRVKTVQVKAGPMKLASAGPSQPAPPVTHAIPARLKSPRRPAPWWRRPRRPTGPKPPRLGDAAAAGQSRHRHRASSACCPPRA